MQKLSNDALQAYADKMRAEEQRLINSGTGNPKPNPSFHELINFIFGRKCDDYVHEMEPPREIP